MKSKCLQVVADKFKTLTCIINLAVKLNIGSVEEKQIDTYKHKWAAISQMYVNAFQVYTLFFLKL